MDPDCSLLVRYYGLAAESWVDQNRRVSPREPSADEGQAEHRTRVAEDWV